MFYWVASHGVYVFLAYVKESRALSGILTTVKLLLMSVS